MSRKSLLINARGKKEFPLVIKAMQYRHHLLPRMSSAQAKDLESQLQPGDQLKRQPMNKTWLLQLKSPQSWQEIVDKYNVSSVRSVINRDDFVNMEKDNALRDASLESCLMRLKKHDATLSNVTKSIKALQAENELLHENNLILSNNQSVLFRAIAELAASEKSMWIPSRHSATIKRLHHAIRK